MRVMWRIEDLAREGARGVLQGDNDVVAAWDLMLLQGEYMIQGSDTVLLLLLLLLLIFCLTTFIELAVPRPLAAGQESDSDSD